jgi:DNA polymerase elongation subunit (family B)
VGEDFGAIFDDLREIDFDELEIDETEDEDDDYGEGEELTPEQVAEYLASKDEVRCVPIPYKMRATKKTIAVVDCETDPFAPGFLIKPFAIGFETDNSYVDFWGDDCVKQFFDYLATLTAEGQEFIIYAHNGGKFDFFFFLDYLDRDQAPLIMGGRLVKIMFAGQEFRDSFAIIPQALSSYKKDEIDYDKFKREVRDQYRAEILRYLRSDCTYTRELITGFHEMFGDKLTIASASLPMLNSFTGFEKIGGDGFDERFRRYYFGGRNQCFETGVLLPKYGSNFFIYDRNSMYPAVMRDELHPISNRPELQTRIDENTDFACIEAENNGALPMRADNGGLDFTVKRGTFYATIHEINAGLETGTLKIIRVLHAWKFDRKASFAEFVDQFYNLRLEAKEKGDKVRDILYKFCLNSGYGKFALNPRKFKQWAMTIGEVPEPQATADNPGGWSLHSQCGDLFIWSRPNPRRGGFYNVATAASITGAARANLLRNLALAKRPVYCDTDSIICEGFNGPLNETELGGWKLEAYGDRIAIGGKKLYTIYNKVDLSERGEAIKKASKGVRLTPQEIIAVCDGKEIVYQNPVPHFNLDGSADFIERRIRATA